MQRQLHGEDVAVRGCRRVQDIIGTAPPDVAVLHWDGAGLEIPSAVQTLREHSEELGILVILPASLHEVEWSLRDLGATAVLPEAEGGGRLAAVCRRILQPLDPPYTAASHARNIACRHQTRRDPV